MNIRTITTSKLLAARILALFFLLGLGIIRVEAAADDSSITFKKPIGSDLFTLTVRDPDGIQEFSLSPVVQFRYGGSLSGCNTSFSSDNVFFNDPGDFTPVMPAYVIDCKNNTTELEISPPVKGAARSVLVKKEVSPTPPPPPLSPPTEEKKEEKKEGPLSVKDVQYPVPDLGNCQNETECRSYCDNANRAKECFAFAKKYNLISAKEAQEATDQFLNVKNGPGGCNSGKSCETYCNDVNHLDACISFAEESGYYSGDELAEAKKFQGLIKAGKQFPGGCKDRNACEIYCGDPNHMEACLNFAEENELIPKEELEQARKILPLMKRGETPGKCTSKEQCEKYCFEEGHSDECVAFGEKAGLISAEDAAMIKKSGGKGPGGCRSKEQCEAYCENNGDACFQWAQDNGSFSEADLAKMKKGMGQFKEQLDKIPPEVTTCLKDSLGEKNFDKLINGKPIFDRSMEGKMKSCFSQLTSQVSKQFNTLPPEATQCIKDIIGEEGLRKIQSGEFDESVDFSSLEGCFQKLQSSFGGGPGGPGGGPGGPGGGGGGFAGPGGCKSIDECTAYCKANPDECQKFAPPGGGGPGGPPGGFPGGGPGGGFPGGGATGGGFPGGPGGCKSQEECTAYCKDHPDECKNFAPPGGDIPGGGFPGGGGGGFPGSPPGGFPGGPGGCTSQETCQAYCQAHPTDSACGGSGGGTPPPYPSGTPYPTGTPIGGGPGGCISQADCQAYCQAHPTDPACGGSGGGTPTAPPWPTPTPTPTSTPGPGGCTSPAECAVYCQTHYTDPICGGMSTPTPPPWPTQTPTPTPSLSPTPTPTQTLTPTPTPSYAQSVYYAQSAYFTPTPTPSPLPQSCVPSPSGLALWLNGDSSSGAVGGVSIVPGKVGNAFKFDVSSGYIKMGNPANLNFGTGPFSLEAWFNWDGGGGGPGGAAIGNIIRKSNYPVSGNGWGYWLRIGIESKILEFFTGETVGNPGQPGGRVTTPISSGSWHHAVATRDSSGAMKLYVDGELKGTTQAPNADTTSEAPFTLGAWDDRFGITEHFSGLIDEASVYNRALSASEVQAIFSAGSAGKCSS